MELSSATGINNAFGMIPKRAESGMLGDLARTFADSGVGAQLVNVDHQILYGRRGTGKTHAFRHLQSQVENRGDLPVFVDLRLIGSAESVSHEIPLVQRASSAERLFSDIVNSICEEIINSYREKDYIQEGGDLVSAVQALRDAVSIKGERQNIEVSTRDELEKNGGAGVEVGTERIALSGSVSDVFSYETKSRFTVTEKLHIVFPDVSAAFARVVQTLNVDRLWVLLDEWVSLPNELQPYVSNYIKRAILPVSGVVVKIAAIEKGSLFRVQLENGALVGIELGADMSANLVLDNYMVFENNKEKAKEFFASLFHKHLTAVDKEIKDHYVDPSLLVSEAFKDRRAFEQLVFASEGVPRDAINIAAIAAADAEHESISVRNIRSAAQAWYQTDKRSALESNEKADAFLNWIIDDVIRGRKARMFLVDQRTKSSELLDYLYDARVVHLAKRGYSSQSAPGVRYDVYAIDYGAYGDLMNTRNAPSGGSLFDWDGQVLDAEISERGGDLGDATVPSKDFRSIRRVVVNAQKFEDKWVSDYRGGTPGDDDLDSGTALMAELDKLVSYRDSGIINDEEFNKLKEKLIP
jgi:hypothetical protein